MRNDEIEELPDEAFMCGHQVNLTESELEQLQTLGQPASSEPPADGYATLTPEASPDEAYKSL
jgi:hypothetical protein